MSSFEEVFKNAINATNPKAKFSTSIGIVKQVNADDTCTVDLYENVRLNAIIDTLQSKFTIYPKVGSKVLITRLEDEDDVFISGFSEIEKVTIKIGKQLLEMYNGKFTIKNGEVDLKEVLNSTYNGLKNAIINTPAGPGNFSPADIKKFTELDNKINQLLI